MLSVKNGVESGWQQSQSRVTVSELRLRSVLKGCDVSNPTEARLNDDLASIDPDHSYDVWHRAGMALFNYYDGSARGLRVWDEWSQRGPKYEDGACAKKWEDLRRKRSQGKYTQTWWHFMNFARAKGAVRVDGPDST